MIPNEVIAPTLAGQGPESLAQAATPERSLDVARISKVLSQPGYLRELILASTLRWINSKGIWGVQPQEFSRINDINPNLAKGIMPALRTEMKELGVCDGVVTPFGYCIGFVPNTQFLALIRKTPEIFSRLMPRDQTIIRSLSDDLIHSDQATIEERFLDLFAKLFLKVDFNEPLPRKSLLKALPDFEGMSEQVSKLLAAMEMMDLVTIAPLPGDQSISPGLLFDGRIKDEELKKKLLDPLRKAEVDPDLKESVLIDPVELQELRAAQVDQQRVKKDERKQAMPASVKPPPKPKRVESEAVTKSEPGKIARGEKMRMDLLSEVAKRGECSRDHLVQVLKCSQELLRYHLKILQKDGKVVLKGEGASAAVALAVS